MQMSAANIKRHLAYLFLLCIVVMVWGFIAPFTTPAMMMAVPEEIGKLSQEEQNRWIEEQTRGGLEEKIEVGKQRHQQRMAAKAEIAESMSDFSVARLNYIRGQQETQNNIKADKGIAMTRYGIPGLAAVLLVILTGYILCRRLTLGDSGKTDSLP